MNRSAPQAIFFEIKAWIEARCRRFFWNKSLNRSAPQAKFLKKCFKTAVNQLIFGFTKSIKQATKSEKLAKFCLSQELESCLSQEFSKRGGTPPGGGSRFLYYITIFSYFGMLLASLWYRSVSNAIKTSVGTGFHLRRWGNFCRWGNFLIQQTQGWGNQEMRKFWWGNLQDTYEEIRK
mgnify:CR=1 FL=1